jgi:ribonuclease G
VKPDQLVLVHSTPEETRVALLEGGQVVELYWERKGDQSVAGSVYKGKVTKVLPGMQAAFVDIGLDKAGFLYVADVTDPTWNYRHLLEDELAEEDGDKEEEEEEGRPKGKNRRGPIQERLTQGQEIMVQVTREPMGGKGAKLTSFVTLPGRNLVYMPTVAHVGLSRRIASDKERRRLRGIVRGMRGEGGGFIIRTVAEGTPKEDLESDAMMLRRLWGSLVKKVERLRAPALLYSDLDLVLKAARDLMTRRTAELIVDGEADYHRLAEFCDEFLPEYRDRIRLHRGETPLFDLHGIEKAINAALEKRVTLPSGGSIIIDETEALVTIDVNTGKFVGRRNLEETLLKANLEAAKEIAYQLRLRNIGGIIIIDFIDMAILGNRETVFQALREAVGTDRARSTVLKISDLGLVEMTRKRSQESLGRTLCRTCPHCGGKGRIKAEPTVASEILREIARSSKGVRKDMLLVVASPDVAALLRGPEAGAIARLEKETGRKITIVADPSTHSERFEVVPVRR